MVAESLSIVRRMNRGRDPTTEAESGVHSEPLRGPSKRSAHRRILAVVIVLAAVVGTSGGVVWVLTRPIELTVTDGSSVGILKADFPNLYDSLHPFVTEFNATTFANETNRPTNGTAAILSLRLTTYAFTDGTTLVMDLNFTVRGRFASNLGLRNLQLAINGTDQSGGGPSILPWAVWATNVSFNFTNKYPGLIPPLSLALANVPTAGPPYIFQFTAIASTRVLDYTARNFIGFRATVVGQIEPAVGVGILLETVYTP